MDVLRSIASWTLLYLVSTCFFLTATVFAVYSVFDAGTIKSTLHEKKVYEAVVPSVLSSVNYDQRSVGQLPLKDPGVRSAVEKAFPPSDLEQKTNTVIDSTFVWLAGKTAKPEFRLDFTQNKEQLATELGNYAQARVQTLPRCTLANLPDNYDPLSIQCVPPGFTAASIGDVVKQQVTNDTNFLENPIVTSDTLSLNPEDTTKQNNAFQNLEGVRAFYQRKTLFMVLLPLLTAIFIAGGLFLASDKAKGLRRLGRSFLISAFSLFLFAFAIGFGTQRFTADVASDATTRDILAPVLTGLVHHMQTVYYIFAGIALLVTIGSFIGSHTIKTRRG